MTEPEDTYKQNLLFFSIEAERFKSFESFWEAFSNHELFEGLEDQWVADFLAKAWEEYMRSECLFSQYAYTYGRNDFDLTKLE